MPLPSTVFSTERVSGPLKSAIETGRRKQILEKTVFDNTDFRTRLESFTVAGSLTSKSILRIQGLAHNAIERGTDYKRFAESLGPDTLKNITSPRVVYRNAINNAYHRARYETQQNIKSIKPFLKYVTFGDERVRPNHAILDGKVAREDDAFWSVNYPPNGHGCRCVARAMSLGDVRRAGVTPKTLPQIEQETRTQQIAAGVAPSKVVRPLADPGWRGSFKLGEPGSDAIIKEIKKYDSARYSSFITPQKTVSPEVFTQVRPIPVGKPFKAISQFEAEQYARLNFAKVSNFDGLELSGMNSTIRALHDAAAGQNLGRFYIAHSIPLERNVFASAGAGGINLNPAYLKSDNHFRRVYGAAGNVAPYTKKRAAIKRTVAELDKEIAAIRESLKRRTAVNPAFKNHSGYSVLRAELKRAQVDRAKLLSIRDFKRHNIGNSVRDVVNHEIAHILTAQKTPGVWSASKSEALRYFDLTNQRLKNKFARYNFEGWMASAEHRAFRRQWLSEYSEKSLNEYIAESFAQWKRGGRVHPEVKRFIEEILIK